MVQYLRSYHVIVLQFELEGCLLALHANFEAKGLILYQINLIKLQILALFPKWSPWSRILLTLVQVEFCLQLIEGRQYLVGLIKYLLNLLAGLLE